MKRLETLEEIVERYCVASSRTKSILYVGLGSMLIILSFIGIWVPGLPTVSFAVPAAFLFSLSSESMFRWTLTNKYFGDAMFEYYATGKTIPHHAKYGIVVLILFMFSLSAVFVWYVSTLGDGQALQPSTWNGSDPGFGATTIIIVGLIGIWYVLFMVQSR